MRGTRREFVRVLGAGGTAALLGGCEGPDALARLAGLDEPETFRPPRSESIDLPSHVLDRLAWGPQPGDRERVEAMGVEAWLDEQLQPGEITDRRCSWRLASLESLAEPTAELYEVQSRQLLEEMTRGKILRAVYSRRQLFEVMVDFWTDQFNIVSEKGDCRWLKTADDRDVIRAHALGRFIDLVRASALSPAMLIYLDGHDNKVERPGDRPNENYARELLELHTLGVDGGYTQRDVLEVARCLSGWTYEHRPFRLRAARVAFVPARHDDGEKLVLGQRIPAGGGASDLERVLEIVCGHPSTARHVATRLCRRFIADPAPSEAVASVAAAFQRTEGEIPATLRALVGTTAFRESRGNLLKRPFRYVVSALRVTRARTDGGRPISRPLERMGHAPFQYPTPDGYPIEPSPWLGTLLWRWNFAVELEEGRLRKTAFDGDRLRRGFGGLEHLAAHLLNRRPTELENELLAGSSRPIALMLASPAFQRH